MVNIAFILKFYFNCKYFFSVAQSVLHFVCLRFVPLSVSRLFFWVCIRDFFNWPNVVEREHYKLI